MEYPGLQNNNKSIEKGPDLIIADSVSKLPYNSKSGSIVEVVNKGVKELALDAIFPHYFYIHINDTSVGDIARTDDGKTLSILENLEAVYYNSNNLKKIIHYLRVAILGLIYREYEVLENLRWKNLNNIKIFTFKSSKEPYLYNGEEWEKMDYVQKSDFAFDNAPTQDSSSLLTSGVIYNELSNKADLINGKVPSSLLPSYVDDVLEFPSIRDFPQIGESGKIYIDINANTSYRWTGSIYKEIQSPIELDEYPILGSTNAIESGGVYSALQKKLDIISDLPEIRLGAALGTTALLSFTETDPTVPSHVKSITQQNITDWNNKQSVLTFDNTPTTNSINPVTSEGIKTALDVKADKTDLNAKQDKKLVVNITINGIYVTADKTFDEIKTAYREGKDIELLENNEYVYYLISASSDGEYLSFEHYKKYEHKITSIVLALSHWELTERYLQERLTFDTAPTANSGNPVTSGGIKTALNNKQPKRLLVTVTMDNTITADKSYQEISEAFQAGADIVIFDGFCNYYHLISYDAGDFYFKAKYYDETDCEYFLHLSEREGWSQNAQAWLEALVSGINIKTINNTSLLGSGNISVQTPLTFDSIPTTSSTNPVTSGGVATALTSYVTLSTSQNITGEKTFVGAKKIKFKKSTANDKLGFTLYDNNNKELCYLEYNTGDLCLGSYYQIPSLQVKSRAGFKMSDVSSGVNAVYRILTPYAADAKIPFNLTSTISDFYFPLGVSNGTTTLITNSTGLLDISSFFNNYYTKTDTDTLLSEKQGTLVSGTDIKTINGNSILGSGDLEIDGDIYYDGAGTGSYSPSTDTINDCIDSLDSRITALGTPNEIASITAVESNVSGGNNTVTITETDGTTTTFNVKNGVDGVSLGEIALVQTTGNSEESVMSQKAVTEYGRKVTAEDLNGTSEWIRTKLTEEGWEFGKILNSNGTIGANSDWMCVSPMMPYTSNHEILFQPQKLNLLGNCYICFYDENNVYKSKSSYVAVPGQSRRYIPSDDTVTQIRFSCNMLDLPRVFVKDLTTGEDIFRGNEYLALFNNHNVTYDLLVNNVIAQELGDNKTMAVSQKCVTDALNFGKLYFSPFDFWGSYSYLKTMSVKSYDLSSEPIIDMVCYKIYTANGTSTSNLILLSNHIMSEDDLVDTSSINYNNSSNTDCIGFCSYGTPSRSMIFVIKQNGNILKSESIGFTVADKYIVASRIDIRRRMAYVKAIKKDSTVESFEVNFSDVALDLERFKSCYMYSTFGGYGGIAETFVAWNDYTHLKLEDYLYDVLNVGKFKKYVIPIEVEKTYNGEKFKIEFNETTLDVLENREIINNRHYKGYLNTETPISVKVSFDETMFSNFNLKVINSNIELRAKIKPSGGNIEFIKGTYGIMRDVFDLTTLNFIEGVDNVYSLIDGHEYEFRYSFRVNSAFYGIRLSGTATIELYEPEIIGCMATNLTPMQYDGRYIYGGIPFLFLLPEKLETMPPYEVNSSSRYINGQMRYNNSKVYINTYDSVNNKFVEKQINNS